jgi:dATP pyrophosphohydrolase
VSAAALAPPEEFKRPESVLVVVYTRDCQTLLLERAWPVFWQSVTGSLEWPDEMPAQAARRELFEETGISSEGGWRDWHLARSFHILPEYRYLYGPGIVDNVEHLFSLELPAPCEVRLDPAEHNRSRWLDLAQAVDSVWSWTNRAGLEQVAAELV